MTGALTNHLWQSTLFAVVAGLMTIAFRKYRAQVRYWLWFSASVKFLVPFSLLMTLGSHVDWNPAAQQIVPPSLSFRMVQITQPFPPSTAVTRDWIPIAILGVWAVGFAVIVLMR